MHNIIFKSTKKDCKINKFC